MENVCIDKSAMADLVRLTTEMNDRMESLLLMSDSEVMKSYKKSKEEIKKGDVVSFDDL